MASLVTVSFVIGSLFGYASKSQSPDWWARLDNEYEFRFVMRQGIISSISHFDPSVSVELARASAGKTEEHRVQLLRIFVGA